MSIFREILARVAPSRALPMPDRPGPAFFLPEGGCFRRVRVSYDGAEERNDGPPVHRWAVTIPQDTEGSIVCPMWPKGARLIVKFEGWTP